MNNSTNYDVRKLFKLEDKVYNNLGNSRLDGIQEMFLSMHQEQKQNEQISLVDMNEEMQNLFKTKSVFY